MKKNTFTFLLILIATLTFAQKTVIKADQAPAPIGPYSQAVEANGMVFVAGQIGLNPQTRQLVAGGVEAETAQIMENIKAILGAAKLSMDDIVNATLYVKDLANFPKVNEIYGKYFTANFPARATIGVDNLPAGAAVEIAVIAVRGPRKK
ncbi:Rid family detoxifying hydrolase [Runella slithyformis]|uniref:Endoribonuclease L-PSP n=1 Tax=Runella slithyformis (strain ATCC 29530 / DSM 19594 / LMG 11500 / NCIMB 11436 / LSU 4) TaxID=761193 RepID=A0A7U3ZGJ5_RUNSL|nr:Rid family detoxifying hydrolase [Runella slithyformis]AEI46831.1 endoribonuclease L-PSP [Runella slithyformis DSM 19594]